MSKTPNLNKYLARVLSSETNSNYTEPKLYIPRKLIGNKKYPDLSKRWYVYYYFRHHESDKKKLWKIYQDINRLKTVAERQDYGNFIIKVMSKNLFNGYNPYLDEIDDIKQPTKPDQKFNHSGPEVNTLKNALVYALNKKKTSIKKNTYTGYKNKVDNLLNYLETEKLQGLSVLDFTFNHALSYIDYVRDTGIDATTIDNIRRELSAVFGVLKKDRILKENFFSEIQTSKSRPSAHVLFTKTQLESLKSYLLKNDLNLYYFFQFVMYTYLRNIEVVRLQVKNFDLAKRVLKIENTKTENITYKPLTGKIIHLLKEVYKIEDKPLNHFIFTNEAGKTGNWSIAEKGKTKFFSERFKFIKQNVKSLNLTNDHTIYGSRHTMISDVCLQLLESGLNEREMIFKLMDITGHNSEKALRKYLRGIGAIIPKSSESITTIDF